MSLRSSARLFEFSMVSAKFAFWNLIQNFHTRVFFSNNLGTTHNIGSWVALMYHFDFFFWELKLRWNTSIATTTPKRYHLKVRAQITSGRFQAGTNIYFQFNQLFTRKWLQLATYAIWWLVLLKLIYEIDFQLFWSFLDSPHQTVKYHEQKNPP